MIHPCCIYIVGATPVTTNWTVSANFFEGRPSVHGALFPPQIFLSAVRASKFCCVVYTWLTFFDLHYHVR